MEPVEPAVATPAAAAPNTATPPAEGAASVEQPTTKPVPEPPTASAIPVPPAEATAAPASEVDAKIRAVCAAVTTLRGYPLLVLFYPTLDGSMEDSDVRDCYLALRDGGLTHEQPLKSCDVLLHTTGGTPAVGYRLAQCIRDFARRVTFLVPEQAYSAGTLLCCSGDQIRLGHCAGLSPIDITMVEEQPSGMSEVELASIDAYLEFSDAAQRHVQDVLASRSVEGISSVASDLLCRLVEEVGTLKVGEYYRTRMLTGHYAEELLEGYMLVGKPNARGRCRTIVRALLVAKPAHEFHIDYHMGADAGLEVAEMTTAESDATKAIVDLLQGLVAEERICPLMTDHLRQPFVAFFPAP